MTDSEKLFRQLAKNIPEAREGKVFGALCIKTTNGKAAAIFWQGSVLFKLDDKLLAEALLLEGATKGHHLYAPEKPMKGWVKLPATQSDKWADFAIKAINTILI